MSILGRLALLFVIVPLVELALLIQMGQNIPGTTIDKLVASMEVHRDALEIEVLKQTPDAFEFNVTGCRYADLYKKHGEPELGYLLLCGMDFPMSEGLSPDLELKRKQTIMQGATYCDFRYLLRKSRCSNTHSSRQNG